MAINEKDRAVLNELMRFYKDFECLRGCNALRKGYFRYSVEEVEETVRRLLNQTSEKSTVKKLNIREEIKMIDSKEKARKFYLEHLTYNKEDDDAKQNCLKNISLDELKLIYSKIYDTEFKSKVTKEALLSLIERYFGGIDRALSMKP